MQVQVDPPPPVTEDTSAAALARKRLAKGKRLSLGVPRFPSLRAWRTKSKSSPRQEPTTVSHDTAEIDLSNPRENSNDQDTYKWAVIYENQRGLTIFSTPYYSRFGLFPRDPPPFTIPEVEGRRDKQPKVSLHNYPLPDGSWDWVSTSWMVDMHSDGQVHYDGFEYNWFFRRHKWRPEPGMFSAGGLVRRRRWVRLMMRSARPIVVEQSNSGDIPTRSTTLPPTRYPALPDKSALELETEKAMVWRGDFDDWKRCHHLMAHLNRDGAKLEVWRDWLGVPPRARPRKVWTEDDYVSPSEDTNGGSMVRTPALEGPQRESLVTVVHDHVEELTQLFIYPESRVELYEILRAANIAVRREDLGVEFWSYRREGAI